MFLKTKGDPNGPTLSKVYLVHPKNRRLSF